MSTVCELQAENAELRRLIQREKAEHADLLVRIAKLERERKARKRLCAKFPVDIVGRLFRKENRDGKSLREDVCEFIADNRTLDEFQLCEESMTRVCNDFAEQIRTFLVEANLE